MSDARLVLRQARWSLLRWLRVRETVFFAVVFPILLLLLFNSVFASGAATTTEIAGGGEIAQEAYFTAGMIAYSVTFAAFSTLAISLVTQRETGELKRLRGTPLPAWVFVTAQVLRVGVIAGALVAALLLIGVVAFGVEVDAAALAGIAVTAVLATGTAAVLGVALSAVMRSTDTASAVAPFAVVILGFVSGVFLPVEVLPGALVTLGEIFPLAAFAQGFQRALLLDGTGLEARNLVIPLAWFAVGLVVAARGFRWEPRGSQ